MGDGTAGKVDGSKGRPRLTQRLQALSSQNTWYVLTDLAREVSATITSQPLFHVLLTSPQRCLSAAELIDSSRRPHNFLAVSSVGTILPEIRTASLKSQTNESEIITNQSTNLLRLLLFTKVPL